MAEDNCHPTLASCTNIVGGSGSFECACVTGYTGDGVTCTSMGVSTIYNVRSLIACMSMGINTIMLALSLYCTL